MASLSSLYILVPVALHGALFCARLGVERGLALRWGTWLVLLIFCGLMFVEGAVEAFTRIVDADAPACGLFLFACFAVLRADPPAPSRIGFGWTLAAGAVGALSVGREPMFLGSVGALALYTSWSAGWRRALAFALAAAVVGGVIPVNHAAAVFRATRWPGQFPFYCVEAALMAIVLGYRFFRPIPSAASWPTSAASAVGTAAVERLPGASAHRMIGCLLFAAALGTPTVIATAPDGIASRGRFVGLPLCVAISLLGTELLERFDHCRRQGSHASRFRN